MLEIKVDESDALKAVLRIGKSVTPPGPLLQKIGMDLAESTMQRFPRGVSPAGVKWVPKSALTLMLYPGGGTRPLIGEGKNLSTSISHQVRGNSVHVGSAVHYAAIHQFGGTIKPKKAKVLAIGGYKRAKENGTWAKIVRIPARPFLGLSEQDRADTLETIRDWIAHHGQAE